MTYIIKQDIAGINKQIATLQAHVKQQNVQRSTKTPEGKQVDEHNSNVVMLLQSKLASTSMTFKDVLEVRTQVRNSLIYSCDCGSSLTYHTPQNMKESRDRTEQFMHATSTAATQAPPSELSHRPFVEIGAQQLPKDSLLFNQRDGSEFAGEGSLLRHDKKGKGRAQHNGDILAMDLITAEEGVNNQNGGAFMQMQLMEQQVSET